MRTQNSDKSILRAGFSLVEIVAVVVIAAMVTLAVLDVYNRAQSTMASVNTRIDNQMVPNEIMQRIAEDVDRLTLPGLETKITIANKFDGRYNLSQMTIITQFYDHSIPPKPQIFEKVVWQSAYDPIEGTVMLYRSHSGINLEDRIVGQDLAKRQRGGRELFIPVKTGITFFEIVVPQGDQILRSWKSSTLPRMIRITLSLAEMQEDFITGNLVVSEDDKVSRIIAIDRTRLMTYKFKRKIFEIEDGEPNSIFTDGLDIGDAEDAENATDTAEPGANDTDTGEGPGDPDLPIEPPEPNPGDENKE